jgi:hypothetical protein
VYVLQLDRFKFQAPPISMQNFAADRVALLSEWSEHWFMTKNTIVCTKYRKYHAIVSTFLDTCWQISMFFVMNQCSDRSESSANRSAAKFSIDIGGAWSLKRSSCKTYTFCVRFSYFSWVRIFYCIYIYIYIYIYMNMNIVICNSKSYYCVTLYVLYNEI